MTQALLLLGSNIAKEINMPAAVELLRNHPQITVVGVSPTYATAPVAADGGQSNQPPFYNAAALIETDLDPAALRSALRQIEATLGRVRNADKFSPRTIDLDIAYYADTVAVLDGNQIPDADGLRFAHAAVPLAAVAPDWVHPQTGQTLREVARGFTDAELEIVK